MSFRDDIKQLKLLADIECGRIDYGHDYDNCPHCTARQALNEIGELASIAMREQRIGRKTESLAELARLAARIRGAMKPAPPCSLCGLKPSMYHTHTPTTP